MIFMKQTRNSTFLTVMLLVWIALCQLHCQTGYSDHHHIQHEAAEVSGSEKANIQTDQVQTSEVFHKQLIVVLTEGWDQLEGKLYRFFYDQSEWKQAYAPISIVVGKNGLGWGSGLPLPPDIIEEEDPMKKEGDLTSPAGVFRFGNAFGYSPIENATEIPSNYIRIDEYTQCIEDINSTYYNKIVTNKLSGKDWTSTDHMLREDDLYEWGIEIAHNYEKPLAGKGSCIFLHVWRNAHSGTAGCTAMEKEEMYRILRWIQPDLGPVLVQVPRSYYSAIADMYNLPQINR